MRLPNGNVEAMIEPSQIGRLMLIFGVGYLAVFGLRVALFACYRKREQLELTRLELFDTVSSVQEYLLHCGIAIVSITSVLIGGPRMASVAGLIYMMTGVVMAVQLWGNAGDVWRTRWRPPSLSQLSASQTQLE